LVKSTRGRPKKGEGGGEEEKKNEVDIVLTVLLTRQDGRFANVDEQEFRWRREGRKKGSA